MRKFIFSILSIFLIFSFVSAKDIDAQTKSKLKQILQNVKEYAAKNGIDNTLKEVTPNGKFGVQSLGENYIWVLNQQGFMVQHGANPKLNGKKVIVLKDIYGTYFVREFINKANNGGGFTFYVWVNPKTRKLQDKVAYCELISNYVFCTGQYIQ